jgi:hypothetical protein
VRKASIGLSPPVTLRFYRPNGLTRHYAATSLHTLRTAGAVAGGRADGRRLP